MASENAHPFFRHGLWNRNPLKDFQIKMIKLGAATHSTVNGISRGKLSRGTSHLGFSVPWFQRFSRIAISQGKTNVTQMWREIELQLFESWSLIQEN